MLSRDRSSVHVKMDLNKIKKYLNAVISDFDKSQCSQKQNESEYTVSIGVIDTL